MKNKKEKTKDHSNTVWFIKVFISTFILSMIFSYVSAQILATFGAFRINFIESFDPFTFFVAFA